MSFVDVLQITLPLQQIGTLIVFDTVNVPILSVFLVTLHDTCLVIMERLRALPPY